MSHFSYFFFLRTPGSYGRVHTRSLASMWENSAPLCFLNLSSFSFHPISSLWLSRLSPFASASITKHSALRNLSNTTQMERSPLPSFPSLSVTLALGEKKEEDEEKKKKLCFCCYSEFCINREVSRLFWSKILEQSEGHHSLPVYT